MSDDIVDELRTYLLPDMLCNHSELFEKAADEIERLRENNGYLNKTVDLLLAANKKRRSSGKSE